MTGRTIFLLLPALAVAAALAGSLALESHTPVPAAYAQQPDNGDCAPDPVDCIFRFTDTPVVERPEIGRTGGARLIEVDPVADKIYVAYDNAVAAYDAGRPGYPLLYNATFPGASGNPVEDMAADTKTGDLYVATDYGGTTYLHKMDSSGVRIANVTLAPPRYHDGMLETPVPDTLHVDSERGLVYISTVRHGILVANMTAEPPAFLPYGWSAAGSGGWRETYHAWFVTAMAVNSSSSASGNATAYAMTMYWDDAARQYTMGLNTLEFDGSGGSFNPNYTAIDNMILRTGYAGTRDANSTAHDMALDDRNDKLFVLFRNGTLAWYDLSNRTSGATGLPTLGGQLEGTDGSYRDLALDERRGLLYWATSTNVGVYRTSDGERLAVVDRPSWSGGAVAIDAIAASAAVPAAAGGRSAADLDSGIVYALGLSGPSLTVIDPRPESVPERLAREAPDGGVVAIPDGTYRDVYLTTNAGGAEKAMTIRSESGRPGGVVLTGASHILVRNSDVAVQGIVFRDTTCHDKLESAHSRNGYLPEYVVSVGVHTSRDGNITIADNVFENTCYGGILSGGFDGDGSGSASNVLIANNTFRDIGYNARHYDGVPDEPRNAIRTGVYSRAVQMQNSEIASNTFERVAGVAVDVRQARGVDVSGNTFEGIAHSAVWVRGGSDGVAVRGNTMANVSYAPNHDFLRGVEGSANLTQEAAILVVPGDGNRLGPTDNVNVTGNTISESGGAFSVCGSACEGYGAGYGSIWGPGVNLIVGPGGQDIRFNWNVVDESNGDRLVENGVRGKLDARYNYYPGYEPAAGAFVAGTPASGASPAGSVSYEPLFTLAPDDAAAPSVLRVTSGNASTGYVAGESIDIMVVFTKPVAVSAGAAPVLTIDAGPADRDLALWRHDASVLVFRYTVAAGDSSGGLEYANVTSLSIAAGGSIADASTGTAAELALPALGSAGSLSSRGITIGTPDTIAPSILSVTSGSADGTYGINELVEVRVAFDEAVLVGTAGGTPTLVLETGGTDRHAVYARGSGTSTLVFSYYPTYGDMSGDLDYAGTGALMLNGGTITDVVRNMANLTLPAPGSNGSLAGSKDIQVMVPMRVGNGACAAPAECSYSATGAFALPPGLTAQGSGTGARLAAMDSTGGLLYIASPGSPPAVSILNASDGFSEVRTHTIGGNTTYILDIAANARDGTAYVLAHDTAGTDDWPSPWYYKDVQPIDDEVFIRTINGTGTGGDLLPDRTMLKIVGRNGSEASPRPDDALAVDADGRRLYAATLDGIVTIPLGQGGVPAGQASPVSANATDAQGTRISAMAVDAAAGIAYAAAAYVLADDGDNRTLDMTYGLMALNFTGTDGMFSANYTRAGSLDIHANPSILPADAGSFAAGDMALDAAGGRLYVAWINGTVSSYAVSAAAAGPAPAFDRHLEAPEWDVVDIEFDAGSGVLYAVTAPDDGTRLGLVAYDAAAGTIAGRVDVPAGVAGAASAAAIGGSLYGRSGIAVVAGAAEHGLEYGPVHVVPGSGGTGYTVDPKPRSIPEILVDAAVPGSTVVIPDGTYVDVDLSLGEKELSITSASGQPGGVVFTGVSHLLVRDGGATVEGMSFRDIECAVHEYVVEVAAWDGVDTDIAIRNNEIAGTCPGGIDIGGARDGRVERIAVENNTLSGIGTYAAPSAAAAAAAAPAAPRAAIHTGQADESVQVRDAAFLSNTIDSTSGTGIEIGQGRNVTVAGNDIRGTPGSAIVVGGGSDGVAITGNYIAGANAEPDFDYLSGVSGSLPAGYEAAILVKPGDGGVLGPTDNVLASGNTISASAGAFSVCGDVCEIRGAAYDVQWGPGAQNHVIGLLPGGQDITFSDNTVHENNTGVLVRNDARGVLDARYNAYPGYVPDASRFAPPSGVAWDLAPTEPSADARFAGPSTVVINYTAPLGPPAGYDGEVYGAVTGPGGLAASVAGVDGLGTATHTVDLAGAGVNSTQTAEIAVNTRLEGTGADRTRYELAAGGTIPVKAAGAAAAVSSPSGRAPIVEITPESFVREVNVTGAGEAVRAAINVTALGAAPLAPDPAANVLAFPPEGVTIRASFAEVTVPPNATATSVPADGLIELYVSDSPPARADVAAALGLGGAQAVVVGRVVEVGDDAEHIAFDPPIRILLIGQAGGEAFYVNNTDGAVVPIGTDCAADDTAAVSAQLGGSGECQLDTDDGDKAVHTYHLTRFGTAMANGTWMPPASPPEDYPATALVNMTAQAAAGGTVAVPPGEYGEDVLIVNKSLTIEPADPGNPPVFTGYSHIVVRPAEADGPVVIRGIAFMNTTYTPDGAGRASIVIESRAGAAPSNATVQPVVIEGSTFGDTCDTAIRAEAERGAPPIAGLVIRNNTFYGIGSNTAGCEPAPGRADAIAAGRAHDGPYDGRFEAGGAAQLRSLSILDNYIFGTTNTGIRVAGADGLAVTGNHIEGVPDDGIRILPSRDAVVRGNTIVGANGAPHMPGANDGAAIEVWSGSDDVAVSLNRISGSAGAFYVCAGTCDPGAGGSAAPVPVAAFDVGSADGANDIRFNHNVIAASNTGALIANDAGGMLNARANYYPGHALSAAVDALYLASPSRAGGTVQVAPTLDGAGPVRIGAIVADGAGSPVRSAEAAVRAAFELGIRDFNAMQAAVGGFVGLEPVVHSVQSPDYTPSARAEHAAALDTLRTGAGGDARMLPVLHNSISAAMAAYDGNRTGALAEISAMGATYGHYPFVNARNGTIVAHGANASLVGDSQIVRGLAGGADALVALFDFTSAETGVAPGHPGAPWKWWTYSFADPSAAGETRSKRSVIALHPGPDGTFHNGDDLVFGAGYYPQGPPSHMVVSAGDAPAAVNASDGMVIVSPASTAAQLAAPDMMFRLAPPDTILAGVVLDAATSRSAAGGAASAVIALNDSASLQSMGLAGELARLDRQGALPDRLTRGGGVTVVSYNSSEPGWGAGAAGGIRSAAGQQQQQSGSTAVVYSGRAGAFADLAAAFGNGSSAQPPADTAWYATGELGRAELALASMSSSPSIAPFARAASLVVISQHASPSTAVDSALAASGMLDSDLDISTRGAAYAAYDAAGLLGRAITSTAGVPGSPADVASALQNEVVRTHSGALGSLLVLDSNGDLVLPVAYARSLFPAAAGGEWRSPDRIEGERTCGILLEKSLLDFGIIAPGQRSRIDTQTVINTGTLPYDTVTIVPTDWMYAGTNAATLPASLTQMRELGSTASFVGLASGLEVASDLDPGMSSRIQYRLDLTANPALEAGMISQTVNYSVECKAASAP